jgi:hypothetical protein
VITTAAVMAALVVLTSCSATPRTAIRVNADGTIDFASCVEVSSVTRITAFTVSRAGPNGQIDGSTEVQLDLVGEPVETLPIGRVITFEGAPETWDRLDVAVDGDDAWANGIAERDRIEIGDWYWGEEGPFSGLYPTERCELDGA